MKLNSKRQHLTQNDQGFNVWHTSKDMKDVDLHQTALILCDVWDNHWSRAANLRLAPMLPLMEQVVQTLRKKGVFILHAPSDTMDYYADTPARSRMQQVPHIEPQIVNSCADRIMPVDASDGGSDSGEPADMVNKRVWNCQHSAISIDMERDGISDDGVEVYSYLKQSNITTVLLMGVHTNMCVLNRSFAIKNLVRWGFTVYLIRDLTDLMYNPAMPPYVSHEEGLALTLGYIEKFWCPTIVSGDLLKE